MKHIELLKRLLAQMHHSWMDEKDRAEFDEIMIVRFGAQIDADLDAGIAKGYSLEQQEQMVSRLFDALK